MKIAHVVWDVDLDAPVITSCSWDSQESGGEPAFSFAL